MVVSASAQRALVWWALAFTAIYGAAFIFLMKMAPPPPPTLTPEQVAAFYAANAATERLGTAIAAWTSGFMVPLAVVIAVQLARLEKGVPIWAITELVGGIMMSIFLVLPPDFWGAAAFHPDRLPAATAVINDLANLTLVTTDQYYMFQLVPIIVVALTTAARADSPFPRWFGYYTLFTGLIFEVGPLGFLFSGGPFAWNGVVVFWLPFIFFGLWIAVTSVLILRAIKRQKS